MSANNVLKIRAGNVGWLYGFLMNHKLSGQKSILRTRFCNFLADRYEQMQKEASLLSDDEQKSHWNQDVVIDLLQERKDMILCVKDIVLNSDLETSNEDAVLHCHFYDIFNQLKYDE